MKPSRSLFAAVLGIAMLSAGAVGAGPLLSQSASSGETIGTAAKGPKPYQALKSATCAGAQCVVEFPKKAKPRNIRLVSCGFTTDGEPLLGGVLFGGGNVQFYLPLASSAVTNTGKVGVIAFPFDFTLPADTTMTVVLNVTGTPQTGNCTLTGTIG